MKTRRVKYDSERSQDSVAPLTIRRSIKSFHYENTQNGNNFKRDGHLSNVEKDAMTAIINEMILICAQISRWHASYRINFVQYVLSTAFIRNFEIRSCIPTFQLIIKIHQAICIICQNFQCITLLIYFEHYCVQTIFSYFKNPPHCETKFTESTKFCFSGAWLKVRKINTIRVLIFQTKKY